MRIRSRWRQSDRPRSPTDNASALAYIMWQVALTAARQLYAEQFEYRTDRQRIGVLGEYLAFLVHVCDRLVFTDMDPAARAEFVTAVARETARHLQCNCVELLGPADYAGPYIALVNECAEFYAAMSFDDGAAGYDMCRAFAHRILHLTGSAWQDRWVLDHVIEQDAPAAVRHVGDAIRELFATGQRG